MTAQSKYLKRSAPRVHLNFSIKSHRERRVGGSCRRKSFRRRYPEDGKTTMAYQKRFFFFFNFWARITHNFNFRGLFEHWVYGGRAVPSFHSYDLFFNVMNKISIMFSLSSIKLWTKRDRHVVCVYAFKRFASVSWWLLCTFWPT